MNLEPHTLDSLRKLIRDLQKENKQLRTLLAESNIPYESSEVFTETATDSPEYDLDQGARIIHRHIDEHMATRFFAMFWGREDVFAKRAKNGNYYPQCKNRWDNSAIALCPRQRNEKIRCEECPNRQWLKLTPKILLNHLWGSKEDGTDVVGVYPLFPDGTCRFLVFDFDNHEKDAEKNDFANEDDLWQDEVNALRMICSQNGIDALVERSRSGRGAHVWVFFQKPISALVARNFGFLLLDKGATTINLKSFRYYDRMYPSQDVANSIGNLVALPLQGRALKEGNSAFIDEHWNAYPDQWTKLFQTRKLSKEEVHQYIENWERELETKKVSSNYAKNRSRVKPWKRNDEFLDSDVVGKLHIVLADGVYIDALNLAPRLQNQIRCMAAFDNPVFYKNKRLGYSNYYNFSTVYMGEDVDGYIRIPRGLLENVISECKKAEISYDIEDQREKGRPIRVSFLGELRVQQELAAQRLLAYEHGILSAATAFGKTVVCSYLIAQRKVNTLILLESTDLISQWEDELKRFLLIDEELPEYKTKTGRIKKRKSVIGTLKGGKDSMTGIVDIAMVGSLYKKGKFHEMLNSYGMVIMDECHHAASATAQEILKKVNARYVYGVSATPMRSDNLEKINYMLLGSIRHRFTAKDRAVEQGIAHIVIPRYTRVVNTLSGKPNISEYYDLICKSALRNEQILDDLKKCVENGKTPVVLTRFKAHARYLYEQAKSFADHVFILYGDNSNKENDMIREQLKGIPRKRSLVLFATGQKIGEGFDYPRLDTLLLVSPISGEGLLEQYVGRLNRDYDGKTEVVVYDYVDCHIRTLNNMYLKRLKTYRRIGFHIRTNTFTDKQEVNAIYDSATYMDTFERDLIEAEQEIVVSSPLLVKEKVDRFIYLVKSRQEAGVKVTVIVDDPEKNSYENVFFSYVLIDEMKNAGITVKVVEEAGHFAVIDGLLVWHGGMNLLGREDAWDNLIRIKDRKVAVELMEMTFLQ